MTARDTLVTTLESLFARTRNGRMDAHRAEAERLVDEALREQAGALSEGLLHVADSGLCCVSQVDGMWEAAERLGDDFDALIRASVERAEEKRKARLYPYDLEVNV
ncbi:hypothetical protein [Streptomyces sp. NPDC005302]|uniref:hypothetical protein n=1 Tax=Streptomyces sp. NPDC005302 TaxID=3154675 RepID=UPI0033A29546